MIEKKQEHKKEGLENWRIKEEEKLHKNKKQTIGGWRKRNNTENGRIEKSKIKKKKKNV